MMIRRFLMATTLLLTLPVGTAALAAQAVVIESTAEAYPAGQVLEETADVTLAAGARLSIITAEGNQIDLTGPYQGKVAAAAGGKATVATALASLIAERGLDTSTVGAVRVTNPQGELPEPWLVDTTKTGNVCVKAGSTLTLFRHDSAAEDFIAISSTDGSVSQDLPWPAGDFYLPLGAEVQVADKMDVRFQSAAGEATVTFHTVPASIEGRLAAAVLASKGCNDQAVALLRNHKH